MAFKYVFFVCLSYYLLISNRVAGGPSGVHHEYQEDSTETKPTYALEQGTVVLKSGWPMFYQVAGTGEKVLVLIDGTFGCIAAHHFKNFYESIDLERTFKVVQIDLPGFGGSRRFYNNEVCERTYPDANFFDRDANAVIETLEKLNIGKYSILGWGFGGTVALYVTSKAPLNVDSCIEWGAKPYPTKKFITEAKKSTKSSKQWKKKTRETLTQIYTYEYLDETHRRLLKGWDMLNSVGNEPSHQTLQNITKPVLLIYGSDDPYAGDSQTQKMEEDIQGSKVVVFKTSKHALHEFEEFTEVVLQYLNDPINYPEVDPLIITVPENN